MNTLPDDVLDIIYEKKHKLELQPILKEINNINVRKYNECIDLIQKLRDTVIDNVNNERLVERSYRRYKCETSEYCCYCNNHRHGDGMGFDTKIHHLDANSELYVLECMYNDGIIDYEKYLSKSLQLDDNHDDWSGTYFTYGMNDDFGDEFEEDFEEEFKWQYTDYGYAVIDENYSNMSYFVSHVRTEHNIGNSTSTRQILKKYRDILNQIHMSDQKVILIQAYFRGYMSRKKTKQEKLKLMLSEIKKQIAIAQACIKSKRTTHYRYNY